MGRPRKVQTEEAGDGGKTVSLKYVGPAGQGSVEVAQACGEGMPLEPGKTYELPSDLADSLLAGSASWEK
jgi:hypothetical protein